MSFVATQAAITDIVASCRMAYDSRKKPLFVEYVSLGNMYVAFTIEVLKIRFVIFPIVPGDLRKIIIFKLVGILE